MQPALTTRGFKEGDFERVGDLLHRAVQIGLRVQAKTGAQLADFIKAIADDEEITVRGLAQLRSSGSLTRSCLLLQQALRAEVQSFARSFPMPGIDVSSMRYRE